MALSVDDREIRPITADEAIRMVELGIIGEDERVELLDGVLTAMSPNHHPHAVVVQRLNAWLAPLMVRGEHDVRIQLPLRVPDETSLPEPDVAVIAHDPAADDHPRTAVLVIEVANSSHRIDLRRKPPLYASAGVREYWVVDVPGRRVVRFTGPEGDHYAQQASTEAPASVRPGAVETDPLDLGELLAGT